MYKTPLKLWLVLNISFSSVIVAMRQFSPAAHIPQASVTITIHVPAIYQTPSNTPLSAKSSSAESTPSGTPTASPEGSPVVNRLGLCSNCEHAQTQAVMVTTECHHALCEMCAGKMKADECPTCKKGRFECSLCFERMDKTSATKYPIDLACSHMVHTFCAECIWNWSRTRGAAATCPSCRESTVPHEKSICEICHMIVKDGMAPRIYCCVPKAWNGWKGQVVNGRIVRHFFHAKCLNEHMLRTPPNQTALTGQLRNYHVANDALVIYCPVHYQNQDEKGEIRISDAEHKQFLEVEPAVADDGRLSPRTAQALQRQVEWRETVGIIVNPRIRYRQPPPPFFAGLLDVFRGFFSSSS